MTPTAGQAPILTVTLNPALDISTGVDAVVPELKLRCDAPQVDPGGGGINVSRSVARMGGVSTALVALGGATGMRLAGLLTDAGLDVAQLDAPGETRQSLAVSDREQRARSSALSCRGRTGRRATSTPPCAPSRMPRWRMASWCCRDRTRPACRPILPCGWRRRCARLARG